MRGRYIVLEGGERVGKSTQAEVIVDRINRRGPYKARYIREPGGTDEGEFLRELALNKGVRIGKVELTAWQKALLHNSARIIMLATVVKPLLEHEVWVISDRSYLSTLVYQGHAEGGDMAALRQLTAGALKVLEPDLIVVLDAEPERMLLRRNDAGSNDRYDNLELAFHHKIKEGYRKEANHGYLHPMINADDDEQAVTEQIWEEMRKRFERGG